MKSMKGCTTEGEVNRRVIEDTKYAKYEQHLMTTRNTLKIFDSKKVRTVWDENEQKWFISIIDAIEVLTDSPNPRKYWSVLKTRLKSEGNQTATNCSRLKMLAPDGKMRFTDVADVEPLFRLIQLIPLFNYEWPTQSKIKVVKVQTKPFHPLTDRREFTSTNTNYLRVIL